MDSASIAHISATNSNLNKKLLRALTVKFNHANNESDKAKKTAQFLNIQHEIIDFSKFDFLNYLEKLSLFTLLLLSILIV